MGEFFQNKLTSGEVFQRGKKKRRKREEKSGKGEEKEREKGRKRDNKVRNVLKREEKFLKRAFFLWFFPFKKFVRT